MYPHKAYQRTMTSVSEHFFMSFSSLSYLKREAHQKEAWPLKNTACGLQAQKSQYISDWEINNGLGTDFWSGWGGGGGFFKRRK